MKLPDDQIVCVVCREIIHKDKSKRCVIYVEWGSLSGTPHYGQCCEKHETDSQGYIVGRAYA
jgi:hypothetical protein